MNADDREYEEMRRLLDLFTRLQRWGIAVLGVTALLLVGAATLHDHSVTACSAQPAAIATYWT